VRVSYTVAVDYDPHPKQRAFHRSNKRFKVASAGNRGGKTVAGAAEFVANIFRDLEAGKGKRAVRIGGKRIPRLAYWVVTPTHEIGEYPFREIIRLLAPELVESINNSTRETWLRGDIQIQFKSTERAERLIAASLNGLWMDEASKCKAEAWVGGLRARLADQAGWAIFTSTPYGGQKNWLYAELVAKDGVDEHVGAFHWTTAENIRVPELRAEYEHAKRTQPEAWFKRDWEADWQSFAGLVFPEFNDKSVTTEREFRLKHRLPNRTDDTDLRRLCTRIVAGVDFGFTSPGSIVVVGDMGNGRYVVLDESYAPGRPVTGHASTTWLSECRRLMQRWGISLFTCDYADSGAISDLTVNGIPTAMAWKDVYLGIRRVAEALHPVDGTPGMSIFSHCPNLVRELKSYTWKSSKDQIGFAEVPAENQSDHAIDALRYALVELRPYAEPKREGSRTPIRPLS
jgi:hypothetical protein